MADKTVVEQLAEANAQVKDLTAKLAEGAQKIEALEKQVASLTAENDTLAKSAADATAQAQAAQDAAAKERKAKDEVQAENATLKARLADPSFKAAGTAGEPTPVATGGGEGAGEPSLDALEKQYMAEQDPVKLSILKKQIFDAQSKAKKQ